MADRAEFRAETTRIVGSGLVAAECAALTGGRPDEAGVAACSRIDRIDRAAYVRHGSRVVAIAADVDGLVAGVAEAFAGAPTESIDRFRVDVVDPLGLLPIGTMDATVRLADAIQAGPDLGDPQHRFVVLVRPGALEFCERLTTSDDSWARHDALPWTTSSSLDSRLARALVNLVPDARSIHDPCCGAGSIVVEAASLGVTTTATDRQPAMVGMTRLNLEHVGLRADVERADARETVVDVDAVVTDLPYGRSIDADPDDRRRILDRIVESAPVAVVVAFGDLGEELRSAGFTDVATCTVEKRRDFARTVHAARR